MGTEKKEEVLASEKPVLSEPEHWGIKVIPRSHLRECNLAQKLCLILGETEKVSSVDLTASVYFYSGILETTDLLIQCGVIPLERQKGRKEQHQHKRSAQMFAALHHV